MSNNITFSLFILSLGLLFPAAGRSHENLTPPTVIDIIDIGPGPGFNALPGIGTFSAAVDSRRNLIYVANVGNSTVSVVDGKNDAILTTIASAIDGVTGNLVASNISVGGDTSLPSISSPNNITVNPRNGKIYVSDFGITGPNQVVVLKSYKKERDE